MKRGLSYSLTVRRLVREAGRHDVSWPQAIRERVSENIRLLSTNPQSWIEGWLSSQIASHPPPDVMHKYLLTTDDGPGPATAATIFARMQEVGRGNSNRNKLPRVALNYLLRACHCPADLVTAKEALDLYRLKGVEISEDTALLFIKACARIGSSPSESWTAGSGGGGGAEEEEEGGEAGGEDDDGAAAGFPPFGTSGGAAALATLTDSSMRVGLWSNATAWNYALARLDGAGRLPRAEPQAAEEQQKEEEEEGEEGGEGGKDEVSEAAEAAAEEEAKEEEAKEEESEAVVAARRVLMGLELMQTAGVSPNGHTNQLIARALADLISAEASEGTATATATSGGGGGGGSAAAVPELLQQARDGGALPEPAAAVVEALAEASGSTPAPDAPVDENWPEADEAAFPPGVTLAK